MIITQDRDLFSKALIQKLGKLDLDSQIREVQAQKSLIVHRRSFRMNSPDLQYLDLIENVLLNGEHKTKGRTKETTIALLGKQEMVFDLRESFPLFTSKRVFFRGAFEELMWMIRGQTDVKILQNKGIHIWDGNQLEDGTIGKGYGFQLRHLSVDQIEKLRYTVKYDPDSKRHIVSSWNVDQLDQMALPPCHTLFQFFVSNTGYLSCKLYQRSADLFLGVPFNVAFYSTLTHLLAQDVGLKAGDFIWTGGDCHVYDNHIIQCVTQLGRKPIDPPQFKLINTHDSLYDYEFSDIQIIDYHPHSSIKGEMAV